MEAVDDHKKERVQRDAKRILDVGSIIVKVYRMGQGQERAMQPAQSQISNAPSMDTVVSEKALKGQALSHAVALVFRWYILVLVANSISGSGNRSTSTYQDLCTTPYHLMAETTLWL